MNNFTLEKLRSDVRAATTAQGSSVLALSKRAGLPWGILSRFLSGGGLSGESIEKLWPVLYGEQLEKIEE